MGSAPYFGLRQGVGRHSRFQCMYYVLLSTQMAHTIARHCGLLVQTTVQLCDLHLVVCVNLSHHILKLVRQ